MRNLFILFLSCLMTGLSSCGSNEKASVPVTESPYFLESDRILNVNGLSVRYREEGTSGQPTLLMVHGFTSSLETWDSLTKELQSDFHIIRLDLPGHGLTGPDPQARYTNEDTVMFLSRFIESLGLEKPVVIGNSLGGLIAWRLAAENPEKVSKLILLSPGGFSINGVTEEPVDVPMMVKFYLENAPMAGVKQGTAALFGDPSKLSEARLIEIQNMMQQPGNGEAFVTRASNFTLPDPVEDLKTVTVPTLIIWGEKDVMVPVAHATDFVAAMPNAVLKIYTDIGHVPQEESPLKLSEDIREFLLEDN